MNLLNTGYIKLDSMFMDTYKYILSKKDYYDKDDWDEQYKLFHEFMDEYLLSGLKEIDEIGLYIQKYGFTDDEIDNVYTINKILIDASTIPQSHNFDESRAMNAFDILLIECIEMMPFKIEMAYELRKRREVK